MKHEIRIYIDRYDICQRMIIRYYKLYGKFIPLPQPEGIWKKILIDFITDLPLSLYKRIVYDAILVVINKYSKIIEFVPCNKETTAEELTKIIKNEIIKHFGMFKSYISNKNNLFTSA